jgi:hypothetical protein
MLEPVRASLMARGYTQEDHDYAFSRLTKLGQIPVVGESLADSQVKNAVIELDAWDEPNMACMQATLDRLHPQQGAFVFENLAPSQGKAAVVGVETLLDRLDRLENGTGRDKSVHKADLAAIATLAKRGYDKRERARLRELVGVAKTVVEAVPLSSDERTDTLLELYGWLNDWATQTRAAVSKRSHLITLGLAKRKQAKGEVTPIVQEPIKPPTN